MDSVDIDLQLDVATADSDRGRLGRAQLPQVAPADDRVKLSRLAQPRIGRTVLVATRAPDFLATDRVEYRQRGPGNGLVVVGPADAAAKVDFTPLALLLLFLVADLDHDMGVAARMTG